MSNEDDLARAAEQARFAHPTGYRHPSVAAQVDSPYAKGVRMTIGVAIAGVVILVIVWAATRPRPAVPARGAPAATGGTSTGTAPAISSDVPAADTTVAPAAVPTQIPGSRTFGTPADAISVQATVVDNDHVHVVIQNRDGRAILGAEVLFVPVSDPNGVAGSVSIPGLAAMQKLDLVVPVDSIGQRLPTGPIELVKITGARFASP